MADAQQFGYRTPDSGPDAAPAPAVPDNVLAAFSTCAGQAFERLHIAKANDAYAYVQNLRSEAFDNAHGDSRMTALNAAWSSCMKTAGYDYPDPLTASDDRTLLGRGLPVPKGATLPPPSPIEKQVAETDVKCKEQVRYEQTFAGLAAEYQTRLIHQDSQRLQQVLAEWQDVLHQAAGAIAAAGR